MLVTGARGALLGPGDLDVAGHHLRAALDHVGYPERPARSVLTAVQIIYADCVQQGTGDERGYVVSVGPDRAITVCVRQANRFTDDGPFPAALGRGNRRHPALDRVGPLLRDRASAVVRHGGTQIVVVIHGGTRLWIIQRLTDWADQHGGWGPRSPDWRSPGHPDWAPRSWPATSTVLNWFGRWPRALAAAELKGRPSARCRWTDDELLGLLRAWADAHDGEAPRSTDWTRGGHPDWNPDDWPYASTVVKAFGGWQPALDRAGVSPRPYRGSTPGRSLPNHIDERQRQ